MRSIRICRHASAYNPSQIKSRTHKMEISIIISTHECAWGNIPKNLVIQEKSSCSGNRGISSKSQVGNCGKLWEIPPREVVLVVRSRCRWCCGGSSYRRTTSTESTLSLRMGRLISRRRPLWLQNRGQMVSSVDVHAAVIIIHPLDCI